MATTQNQPLKKTAPSDKEDNTLFSEGYDSLRDAIERLYIKSNLSGRLIFQKNWARMAKEIFPEELRKFDHDGAATEEEKEKRETLEENAEDKRLEFLDTFAFIDKELLQDGSVKLEALEKVMKKYDRDVCLMFFTSRFVDRYHAPPPEEENDEEETQEQSTPEAREYNSLQTGDTGNINLPPPASKKVDALQEYNQMDRMPKPGEKPQRRVPEHIGHADHSLSQTLTENQHEETSIFGANFEDDLDNLQPIDLTPPPKAPDVQQPVPQEQQAPAEPQQQAQPPETGQTRNEAPEPQTHHQNAPVEPPLQTRPPLQSEPPPLPEAQEDKPLFVADAERDRSGRDASPITPPSHSPGAPPFPGDEEEDKPLFVADSEREQRGMDQENENGDAEPNNIFRPVQRDKKPDDQ